MSTITRTSDSLTTTPDFVEGLYETTYEGTNIQHRLVDGGTALTLAPHLPRTGTLALNYSDRATAWAAVALLLAVDSFSLTDSDLPEVDMMFSAGDVVPAQQIADTLWVVRVDYVELPT